MTQTLDPKNDPERRKFGQPRQEITCQEVREITRRISLREYEEIALGDIARALEHTRTCVECSDFLKTLSKEHE